MRRLRRRNSLSKSAQRRCGQLLELLRLVLPLNVRAQLPQVDVHPGKYQLGVLRLHQAPPGLGGQNHEGRQGVAQRLQLRVEVRVREEHLRDGIGGGAGGGSGGHSGSGGRRGQNRGGGGRGCSGGRRGGGGRCGSRSSRDREGRSGARGRSGRRRIAASNLIQLRQHQSGVLSHGQGWRPLSRALTIRRGHVRLRVGWRVGMAVAVAVALVAVGRVGVHG